MSKIHITLVGGQPAPIYHGIVATQPEKVVYVYSKTSAKTLPALKREVKLPYEEEELDPTSPQKILEKVVELARKYEKDEVTVNISSGLKSWAHFFGLIFDRLPNAAVVYMDQNNILWNYRDMTCKEGFIFDMFTLFRLYGNSLENNYKNYKEYTDEDKKYIEKIEEIRAFNNKGFKDLTSLLTKEQSHVLHNRHRGCFYLDYSPSFVEWEKTTSSKMGFVRICLFNRWGRSKEYVMESKHIVDIVFNTAWFELKVATMLEKWDKAKEIIMNCRFPFKQGVDKNETDIIINTGTKILFVECKTQIANTTDIDKFRSVVKAYGGMGSKGLFVTDSPMRDVARLKCEENGILAFSLQDIEERGDQCKKLFELLDHELFNINI